MNKVKSPVKHALNVIIIFILIPLTVVLGALLLKGKKYNLISVIVAVLSLIPFFIGFEKGKTTAREIMVIACFIALSVIGRMIFAPLPFFKPVTAIVIIAGVFCGAESGFIVGAFSALVSNIYFGQGPWTPFQMLAWGLIGCFAGLLFFKNCRLKLVWITIYGALSGVVYSLVMDYWATVYADGVFILSKYFAFIAASGYVLIMYIISNVIFLLVLLKPLNAAFCRLRYKYGIFGGKTQKKSCEQADSENGKE